MDLLHDNGFFSRKLWLTVFTQVLVAAGGVACVFWPAFAPFYATYTGAVISSCALYFGANVGAKHVIGKHAVALASTEGSPEPKEVPQVGNG